MLTRRDRPVTPRSLSSGQLTPWIVQVGDGDDGGDGGCYGGDGDDGDGESINSNDIFSAGEPQLIIQTDSIVQRIPVDVCSSAGSPCGGVEQCGLRSLCVQRYTYHYLLSFQPGQLHLCPAIRAFKLPTACVCHAQVGEEPDESV